MINLFKKKKEIIYTESEAIKLAEKISVNMMKYGIDQIESTNCNPNSKKEFNRLFEIFKKK